MASSQDPHQAAAPPVIVALSPPADDNNNDTPPRTATGAAAPPPIRIDTSATHSTPAHGLAPPSPAMTTHSSSQQQQQPPIMLGAPISPIGITRGHSRAGSEITWASDTYVGDGDDRSENHLVAAAPPGGGGGSPTRNRQSPSMAVAATTTQSPSHNVAMMSEKQAVNGASGATDAAAKSESTDVEADPTKSKKKKKRSMGSRLKRMIPFVGGGGDSDSDSDDDGEPAAVMTHIDPSQDTTDPTPFTHKPLVLASLVDPKSLEALDALGGVDGVLEGLKVDGLKGLTSAGEEMEERRRVYGKNVLPSKKTKGLLELMWLALKDKVLIILIIAAVVSLALGIYTTVGAEPTLDSFGNPEPKVDWVEGLAILIAVAIVVLVGSINDWQKEKQFQKLNEKKDDRMCNVLRDGGERQSVNTKDLVVGDVCVLEPGEILPVDGLFLRGHGVKCDESSVTGESDLVKKTSYDEHKDCFLLSGSKVTDGVGEYVVIAVGQHSFNGRVMMSLRGDAESTPLQLKLNRLAELIATLGALSGLTLFVALMIRFFVQLATDPNRTPDVKAQSFIQILIISVTLVVVAVPEGLPLAVTLALAFATKRMTSENLLVRVLASCETMANANIICTDKTGTLTQNKMTVVAMSFGRMRLVRRLQEHLDRSNIPDAGAELLELSPSSEDVKEILNQSIAINSTAFSEVNEDGKTVFVGSKTETALLELAAELGYTPAHKMRGEAEVVQMIPFSSEAKSMACVIKVGNIYRLLVKGASEIVSSRATKQLQLDGSVTPLTEEDRQAVADVIQFYASQCLRTIGLCYKDFESWPPAGTTEAEPPLEFLARDITLIGITGIEDPLRDGVVESVSKCQRAGVQVKMCTGDNVLTAKSIAAQCGIFSPGGLVIEGPVFRRLTPAERLDIVPRLQIMARSSPEDKRLLAEAYKTLGSVVAMTGDGANDAPALATANVGFSMGIAGTEIAKEASDIIIMDDSFSSLVKSIIWGRCVNDSVKKFLQFQLSVNVVAVVLTFVSAVASNSESSVLSAVQLLWVNLIMDTFAALALATDPASESSLDRKPDRKTAPLITPEMAKQILGQALYQIVVCFVLHFAGLRILGLESNSQTDAELTALVFNVFVWCQLFNQINCRRLDRHLNCFEGFWRNYWFIGIWIIEVGAQCIILEFGGAAFQTVRLNGRDWGITIIIGLLSIPIGMLLRLLPTDPFERLLIRLHVYSDPNTLPTVVDDDQTLHSEDDFHYNAAFTRVKDSLETFSRLRGGRSRASGVVQKSRFPQKQKRKSLKRLYNPDTYMPERMRSNSVSRKLEKAEFDHQAMLTMLPTLIAGTVGAGAGWIAPSPTKAGAEPVEPFDWKSKIIVHPETPADDPIWEKLGQHKS